MHRVLGKVRPIEIGPGQTLKILLDRRSHRACRRISKRNKTANGFTQYITHIGRFERQTAHPVRSRNRLFCFFVFELFFTP